MRNNILVKNAGDVWEDTQECILARGKEPELPILSLPSLNKKIWGLRKGRLSIIGARTSHGKSAFALQLALDLARQKHSVLFLSLEMTVPEINERLFCLSKAVDNYVLLTGHGGNFLAEMNSFYQEMVSLRLSLSDCIGKKWSDLEEYLRSLKVKPEVIFLDYIQAIKGAGGLDKGVLDEYIRKFREMAIRYNFAGILCSQVNRMNQETNNTDKSPQLHQLKGSGVLEEHADVIFLLWWPYKNGDEDINKYRINVAKNRNGRTGHFDDVRYRPEFYRFEEEAGDSFTYKQAMEEINASV